MGRFNSPSLTFKNDLNEIDGIWSEIETTLKPYCMNRKELFQIRLIVDELFTNIVSYAFKDNREHNIGVHIRIEKKYLVIELEDDGMAFNPVEVASPDTSAPICNRPEGGLGIHFCRQLAAEFSYERRNGKNRITVKKKIKEPELFKKIFSCRRNHGN